MERSGIAINAAMLTAAIGVYARFEADIRTVVVTNYRACSVPQKLRSGERIFVRIPIRVRFQVNFLKPVGRIAGSSASWNRIREHA